MVGSRANQPSTAQIELVISPDDGTSTGSKKELWSRKISELKTACGRASGHHDISWRHTNNLQNLFRNRGKALCMLVRNEHEQRGGAG